MDTVASETAALDLLQYLVQHGGWYVSAIELDDWLEDGELDGEELQRRAVAILTAAGRPTDPQRQPWPEP